MEVSETLLSHVYIHESIGVARLVARSCPYGSVVQSVFRHNNNKKTTSTLEGLIQNFLWWIIIPLPLLNFPTPHDSRDQSLVVCGYTEGLHTHAV